MSLNLQGSFCDIPISTVYPRWTVDELKDRIAFLKRADFDPTVIDTDLHKRVADAIQDWFIRRFDMRVNGHIIMMSMPLIRSTWMYWVTRKDLFLLFDSVWIHEN